MAETVVIFNADGALARQPFAVARSEDVDGGPVAVRLLGRSLVLWRSPGGAVVAAPDSCPHSRGVLSEGKVEDGRLICPKHGWAFGDSGRCVAKPSNLAIADNSHLAAYPCTERHGLVWVSLADPAGEILQLSPAGAEGWRRVGADVAVWRANPIQIVEALLADADSTADQVSTGLPFCVERTTTGDDGTLSRHLVSCAPIDGRTSLVVSLMWTTGESGGDDDRRMSAVTRNMDQAKAQSESEWIPLPTIDTSGDREGSVLGDWKRRFFAMLAPR